MAAYPRAEGERVPELTRVERSGRWLKKTSPHSQQEFSGEENRAQRGEHGQRSRGEREGAAAATG